MELMEMSHFSLSNQGPAKFTLQQPAKDISWDDTISCATEGAPNLGNTLVRACERLVLQNQDVAWINGFGLIRFNNQLHPVQILEILVHARPVEIIGITVKLTPLAINAKNNYDMPQISTGSSETKTIFLKEQELFVTQHTVKKWKNEEKRSQEEKDAKEAGKASRKAKRVPKRKQVEENEN
ncbi:hypothetical protein RSAG8_13565, partial [Rhizoctonia solani AG-8 WAC10335]